MSEQTARIAMWSGPRNISTAMMRSWGSRADTFVTDEPLYAHYLRETGAEHPGRDEVIAHHEADLGKVMQWLTGPIPEDKRIWYQKHMAHHITDLVRDGLGGWIGKLTNCFLIRDPGEMITSYIKVVPEPTAADLGLPQQVELFESERRRTGRVPPVLDSRDVLENPARMIGLLCDAIGIEFDEAMLSWEAGPRETDGMWARYWYGSVEVSTCFSSYTAKDEAVPAQLKNVHEQCTALYEQLAANRLR